MKTFFSILGLIGIGLFWQLMPNPFTDDPVNSRTIISYVEGSSKNEGSIVQYVYTGEALPERLALDEDVSMRTESSYTRDLGSEDEGTPEEQHFYQGTFYTKPTFVNRGGRWYYQETATTTEAAFYRAHPVYLIAKAFTSAVAYAASFSDFSTAGDGQSGESALGEEGMEVTSSLDCTINGASLFQSDASEFGATSDSVLVRLILAGTGSCEVNRGFFTFDTSSITSGSTITEGTFKVWAVSKTNGVTTGDDIIVVTAPSNADFFGLWGSGGGTTANINLGSITTGAYNTWTLNSTGFTWITKGGTTYLGLKEQHDDSGLFTSGTNRVTFSTSEASGTTQDPTLTLTYTPGGTTFWQFQDF